MARWSDLLIIRSRQCSHETLAQGRCHRMWTAARKEAVFLA